MRSAASFSASAVRSAASFSASAVRFSASAVRSAARFSASASFSWSRLISVFSVVTYVQNHGVRKGVSNVGKK